MSFGGNDMSVYMVVAPNIHHGSSIGMWRSDASRRRPCCSRNAEQSM